MQILSDFDLKSSNTFAIPAQAAFFISCESKEDILKLTKDEFFRSQPYLLIGGGSNLLFLKDFKGCVVRYAATDVEIVREDERSVTLRVAAGKRWHDLVLEMAQRGLWGIENLAFIPGDCGAAAVQNIGAYGVEICSVIERVLTVDLRTGTSRAFDRDECTYGYRASVFKQPGMGHYMVYAVELTLSKTPQPQLSYAGLQSLEEKEVLTPADIAAHVIAIRESKLPDPASIPNAGSFFMNPIVDASVYGRIAAQYEQVPHYVTDDKEYKIPAAWLIEQCGYKGKRVGNVGCYEKQPLVIVNHGGATGEEIAALSDRIIADVRSRFGIELHPEVKFIDAGMLSPLEEHS